MKHEQKSLRYYRAELNQIAPLTPEQKRALIQRLPDREAEDTLIQNYLPLVIQIAQGYQEHGVPLPDLIGEGNVGVVQIIRSLALPATTSLHHQISEQLHQIMQQTINAQIEASCAVIDVHDMAPAQAPYLRQLRAQASRCTPEEMLVAKEAWKILVLTLWQFSDLQRASFSLFFGFTGQQPGSCAAAGRELGMSPLTVFSHLSTGIQRLIQVRSALRALRLFNRKGGQP